MRGSWAKACAMSPKRPCWRSNLGLVTVFCAPILSSSGELASSATASAVAGAFPSAGAVEAVGDIFASSFALRRAASQSQSFVPCGRHRRPPSISAGSRLCSASELRLRSFTFCMLSRGKPRLFSATALCFQPVCSSSSRGLRCSCRTTVLDACKKHRHRESSLMSSKPCRDAKALRHRMGSK